MRIVDLSHPFAPGQPHYPGDPDQVTDIVATIDHDGFLMHRYHVVGPWGTHVDAPGHFASGGRTLADIDVAETVLPLVVLDLHPARASLRITPDHIETWEARHGRVPERSFVAAHTGWSKRWHGDFRNDGVFPGWTVAACEMLHERGVTAIGHETPDTDPDLIAQRWWLEHDHWQIECMTGLDQVPESGATIICSWPVPSGGVSFPVRPIALIPSTRQGDTP